MNKGFTNQARKDIPEGYTEEEWTRMYAAFGKVIEIVGSMIEWNKFIDYSHPEDIVLSVNEDGSMIVESVLRIRYFREAEHD